MIQMAGVWILPSFGGKGYHAHADPVQAFFLRKLAFPFSSLSFSFRKIPVVFPPKISLRSFSKVFYVTGDVR